MKAVFLMMFLLGSLLFQSCRPAGQKTITWAVGKDPAGQHQALASQFEELHPGIKVKLLEMPESSTAQHDAYVTYLAAGDRTVDVYSIDIIWPAEFARAGWLVPLDGYFDPGELADFLPGPLAGCTYRDTLWAVPWFTDAGMLYYRQDILEENGLKVPQTWDQLETQASYLSKKYGLAGYVWQGQQYEGLVCNFLEVLWSCGGNLSETDSGLVIDGQAALTALNAMHRMLETGASPRGVLTYKEEEGRQLFTQGQAVFMRNWPYAWALAQDTAKGSRVAGRVGLAPLPHLPGQQSSACLGGWNLAVSRHSKYPEEAAALVKFLTSFSSQRLFALKGGRLPTRKSVYEDTSVIEAFPHYRQFYLSFVNARPRPVRPDYPRLSDELQIELHKILLGKKIGPAMIVEMQKKLQTISVTDRP